MMEKDRGLWEKYFGAWPLLRFATEVKRKEAASTARETGRVLTRCCYCCEQRQKR